MSFSVLRFCALSVRSAAVHGTAWASASEARGQVRAAPTLWPARGVDLDSAGVNCVGVLASALRSCAMKRVAVVCTAYEPKLHADVRTTGPLAALHESEHAHALSLTRSHTETMCEALPHGSMHVIAGHR